MVIQADNVDLVRGKVLIALGSNQSVRSLTPIDLLLRALELIARESFSEIIQSPWFGSAAFPAGSGSDYVNGVISAKTDLDADQTLAVLHRIETALGRERGERWAARTCDLDLLSFDQLVLPDLDTYKAWRDLPLDIQMKKPPDTLILPHPRMTERAFVLGPLVEIAPDWAHPVSGLTAREMLGNLPQKDRDAIWKL